MDESLWPARNAAEYAYCPRLFYYMEVEGIHVSSATLDLAEIDGSVAVPVEYRKGKPRHVAPPSEDGADIVEAWPTDRIQVGLQATIFAIKSVGGKSSRS